MEKRFVGSEMVFESVINNRRNEIIGWLMSKYVNLTRQDGEDIVQEGCYEVWKKLSSLIDLSEDEMMRMWKVISRNIYTHWVRKMRFSEDWDDGKLQYGWEEKDYGWDMGDYNKVLKRELMYDYIDHMKEKDRKLMDMILQRKRMSEISEELGYSSVAVVKNRKCKIIGKMKKALSGMDEIFLPAA